MKRNIVVLLLDTVRASDVYGNGSLPTLDYLYRNCASYSHAISPGTWTATSHAALFANKNVSKIKEASQDFFTDGTDKIDPWMVKTKFLGNDAGTLAKGMSKHGYHSVLFSNNPFLTSFTNLAIGFDKIYDIWLDSNVKYNKGLASKLSFIINGGSAARNAMFSMSATVADMLPGPILDRVYLRLRQRLNEGVARADGTYKLDRGASDTNKALRDYLTYKYNFKPQFMFMNFIEAHENYPIKRDVVQDKWLYLSGIREMREDNMKELHRAYMRRIRYLDGAVSKILHNLKEGGILDKATVVITSDHGQFFGEHGLLYHSLPPYEQVSRVPLIAANYEDGKLVKDREIIDSPMSLLSLNKAFIDLATGREPYLNGNLRKNRYVLSEHTGISEGWDEKLLRRLKGRSKNADMIYKAKSRCNKKVTAVYRDNMKLMHFFGEKQDELYNLAADPNEQDNLMAANRGLANRMRAVLN
ncbi:MAG TPA: sulfatase-like hydrolase/transferase [Candidatus Baltobacteraceae bacterium]|nr:sulfatase-like hydrolase/transferase [Candidatus Baltobacteraceae bacterium]